MARNLRAIVTTSVALAAVSAGSLALSSPASADPTSGFRTYVGVGSDTIQDVENAIAGDVSGVTGTTTAIGSYNAFPQNTQIQTRANGPQFLRPSGSGAGIKALSDALTNTPYNGVNIAGQVDYARSSSGPAAQGTDLTYVPFARDAVSYAYKGKAKTIGKLTTDQLKTIYSSNSPTTINGVVVTPLLPQASSGTRKFFLAAIGVTQTGSQVVETNQPENDGRVLTATNQIIPFSAAQWIGQKSGLVTDTTSGDLLGSPDNVAPIVAKSNGSLVPNTTFYKGSYGRYVYNVASTSRLGSDKPFRKLFVGSTSTFCSTSTQAIVKQFGFASVGSVCGTTDITGPFTP